MMGTMLCNWSESRGQSATCCWSSTKYTIYTDINTLFETMAGFQHHYDTKMCQQLQA